MNPSFSDPTLNGPGATGALPATAPSAPIAWWRVGMVWLVVGGPAVVVVAAIGTAVVAYRGADVVLVDTPSARHAPVRPSSQTPALTARNHAATATADR